MATKRSEEGDSPLMRQHAELKRRYPGAMLLFRVGDFYETFGDDAIRASEVLGITLTRKASGGGSYTELAGIPYHAIEQYLPRLVRAGLRVAICDQLEDPKSAKGLVKRGVTELVTPGVSYNANGIDVKDNNFLCGLHLDDKVMGISFLDISTGEFYLAQGDKDYIDKLLHAFKPSEVVLQRQKLPLFRQLYPEKYYTNTFDDWVFKYDFAEELLTRHFGTTSLKGFGVADLRSGVVAAAVALHYLHETQHDKIDNICSLSRIEEDRYVWVDKFTMRNLELIQSPHENGKTLLGVLDRTITPMGGRLMRRWITLPLKDRDAIEQRLSVVDLLLRERDLAEKLQQLLRLVGDIERLASRVSVGRATPREVQQLRRSLQAVGEIRQLTLNTVPLASMAVTLNSCESISQRIAAEIVDDPPARIDKGNVIRNGVNDELDELRTISGSGRDYLAQIQARESERTGIPSLKIGFNNVYGYYLEVTNTHKDKVPDDWTRRQTLTNAERYITPELKSYEERIMGADERILVLEGHLFNELLTELTTFVPTILTNAHQLAQLDCLLSFATVALSNHYCRPQFVDNPVIRIQAGRHPVIETQMPPETTYVSNDVVLDPDDQQIIVLTGPNMSGKSALLRQTALIVIMAQMGCYCPADAVTLGIVDKVFTRVGASDNLSSGESTFMVEMNETASILNNIGNNSLVLLDEIGRGTSTYDGISIAWAIAEYLHSNGKARPKVLFATHYHELIAMADRYDRIRNYHVSVKEHDNNVIFLRKIEPGGSEHSFGIHVARMAGMPKSVINRATEMLHQLESKSQSISATKKTVKQATAPPPPPGYQLSFIQLDDPTLIDIRNRIVDIDIDSLTPLEALLKLNEIKKIVQKK